MALSTTNPRICTPEFDAEPNKSFISNKTIPALEPNEPKATHAVSALQPPLHRNTKRTHFFFQLKQNKSTYPHPSNPFSPYGNHPSGSQLREFSHNGHRPAPLFLVLLNKGNLKIKESSKAIVENLLHLNLSRNGSGKYGDAPPLRSELFSAEQMKQHGRTLAAQHKLSPGHAPDQLLARLAENESVLIGVHRLMTEAVSASRQITPAGEWLLDNFYLIEEQIRTAKRHLPKRYSRELPRLLSGPSAGLPRVYDIALEIISHGDGRVDAESLTSFVAAYQTVSPLALGELWALPIMLRLALIENLRRVSARIADDRIGRNGADAWADQLITTAERDPKNLIVAIADMARSNPPMDTAFVAELTRRLQGQGPSLTLPITWIEQRLSETGWTIQQMVQSENQKQAANQVSMSNSIGSLRYLSALDWRKFVESMSVVEHALREDVGDVYGRMEFATRDRYRHVVEKIARYSEKLEHDVARKAIELTKEAAAVRGAEDRAAHVGYYLIGEGREQLERSMEARLPFAKRLGRSCRPRAGAPLRGRNRSDHADPDRSAGGEGLLLRGGSMAGGPDRPAIRAWRSASLRSP